jgi:hypothetical protein
MPIDDRNVEAKHTGWKGNQIKDYDKSFAPQPQPYSPKYATKNVKKGANIPFNPSESDDEYERI